MDDLEAQYFELCRACRHPRYRRGMVRHLHETVTTFAALDAEDDGRGDVTWTAYDTS